MNILEQALAAGIVAGCLWAIAYSVKSKKPEFFWKMKPATRIALTFIIAFVLFVMLSY